MIPWHCDCGDNKCPETVDIPKDVANEIRKLNLILIADTCKTGPNKDDGLIRTGKGFKLYE